MLNIIYASHVGVMWERGLINSVIQILSTMNSAINSWLIRSLSYQQLVDNQKILVDSLSIRILLMVDNILLINSVLYIGDLTGNSDSKTIKIQDRAC